MVARATETKPSYTNTVEAKTNLEVQLSSRVNSNTLRDAGEFRYFKATVTTYSVKMTPGITKSLLGHYFPASPGMLETGSTIDPSETLRYQIQIKNEDNSTNYEAATGTAANAPTNSFIKTYTVTDILPVEYTYKPGSTTFAINRTYDRTTGAPS